MTTGCPIDKRIVQQALLEKKGIVLLHRSASWIKKAAEYTIHHTREEAQAERDKRSSHTLTVECINPFLIVYQFVESEKLQSSDQVQNQISHSSNCKQFITATIDTVDCPFTPNKSNLNLTKLKNSILNTLGATTLEYPIFGSTEELVFNDTDFTLCGVVAAPIEKKGLEFKLHLLSGWLSVRQSLIKGHQASGTNSQGTYQIQHNLLAAIRDAIIRY